ncbi:MAG: TIGR03960 family B12-binding radical SAM protein [Clostridiales bacterium]|jgi:radical SAM family uncharacterized protein|nr:TIGR03960 family B12-binding radical SAM protein [Clostridiales bacterium]
MFLPDEILLQVEKPGRYIGNEINMIRKDPSYLRQMGGTRFAFCFPDVYEVGMSHLGMQILYYFLNAREDTYCERSFAPWPDMEARMRENGAELFSLETGDPLRQFDFIGFTLQYEMSYTNVLNMLDLAGVNLFAADRADGDPIICAGGPCAYNPEPLADFIDFFYLGEAETQLGPILDLYRQNNSQNSGRTAFLEQISSIPGVYVPRFYDAVYQADGTIASFQPNHPKAPAKVRRTFPENLDSAYFPEKILVPLIETAQDRAVVEVFRGCARGCRFCQAGYIYRPVRERRADTLLAQAESLIECSGHEEISLVSLSTSDYSQRDEFIPALAERMSPRHISISLPSLRIDAVNLELMAKVREVRRGSLTFAPEAGSQRLRSRVNKGLTEEEILEGARLAFESGWNRIKLYFMIGLPEETEEDIEAIPDLAGKIVETYYQLPREARKHPVQVNLSVACFVPKPFTPFQWAGQDTYDAFMEKQRIIQKKLSKLSKKQIHFSYHDAALSVIEAALARGDRRLGAVLLDVWKSGGRFESWTEHFQYALWEKAFARAGLDMGFYAGRTRAYPEILPWDHINIGVSKTFFIRENEKAQQGQATSNCHIGCGGCGACAKGGRS